MLVEVGFYTAIVFMAILFSFLPEWRNEGFDRGILYLVLLCGFTLYLIRALFPFSTIFTVLPIAFMELVLMGIIIFDLIGE